MPRSRNFLSAFLLLTLNLASHAQNSKTGPTAVKLNRGQTLSVSLLTPIDSGHANVGDDVTLKLIRPLIAEGAIILPAEWTVHAKVTKVKRAGNNCNDGNIVWKLDSVKTPGGDYLKVQEVYSYPLKYSVSSGDPEWVPLDTPLTKIGGAAKFTGALAVSIALSPLLIPMAIAATERCEGRAGEEKSLPAGLGDLFAISKSLRVKPLP